MTAGGAVAAPRSRVSTAAVVMLLLLHLWAVPGASSAAAAAVAAFSAAATTVAPPLAVTDEATLQLQQYDALRVARCAASCWTQPHDAKDECETACLRSRYSKPGACPDASALSAFDVACIDACSGDADCSATDKCCRHACGVTCQSAQGLDQAPGLPAMPRNLTASERRHGRVVLVEWSAGQSDGGAPVLFVLEERHHVGRHLATERLGPWTARHRSARPSAALRCVLRPGRWYEFRVAAVNANGSRGFSPPSRPFRLSLGPRAPGPPRNLSVGALSAGPDGSGLRALLSWEPPVSDLPVQRYKVFWSRRLSADEGVGGGNGNGNGNGSGSGSNGADGTSTASNGKQASVLVHHQTVGGDVLQFMLKALEPNSLYFLQVQAIAQFGRERLKGEKEAKFLNTGDHPINGSSR